jgi:hypothetical protein
LLEKHCTNHCLYIVAEDLSQIMETEQAERAMEPNGLEIASNGPAIASPKVPSLSTKPVRKNQNQNAVPRTLHQLNNHSGQASFASINSDPDRSTITKNNATTGNVSRYHVETQQQTVDEVKTEKSQGSMGQGSVHFLSSLALHVDDKPEESEQVYCALSKVNSNTNPEQKGSQQFVVLTPTESEASTPQFETPEEPIANHPNQLPEQNQGQGNDNVDKSVGISEGPKPNLKLDLTNHLKDTSSTGMASPAIYSPSTFSPMSTTTGEVNRGNKAGWVEDKRKSVMGFLKRLGSKGDDLSVPSTNATDKEEFKNKKKSRMSMGFKSPKSSTMVISGPTLVGPPPTMSKKPGNGSNEIAGSLISTNSPPPPPSFYKKLAEDMSDKSLEPKIEKLQTKPSVTGRKIDMLEAKVTKLAEQVERLLQENIEIKEKLKIMNDK